MAYHRHYSIQKQGFVIYYCNILCYPNFCHAKGRCECPILLILFFIIIPRVLVQTKNPKIAYLSHFKVIYYYII